jgi:hypothetical protein
MAMRSRLRVRAWQARHPVAIKRMAAAVSMDRVTQLREDWRRARVAHDDLQRLGMPRVNLLLTGGHESVQNLIELLIPGLAQPSSTWQPGEPLVLPPITPPATMVLLDVGAMTPEDQRRLSEWLERHGRPTQVIATTSRPLLPRVHTGTFNEDLFYRLNTIAIDLTS